MSSISPENVDPITSQDVFSLEKSKFRIETKAPEERNVESRPGEDCQKHWEINL